MAAIGKQEDLNEFAWRYKLSLEQLLNLNRHVKSTSQLADLSGQWVIVPEVTKTHAPETGTSAGEEKLRDILGSFWQSAQLNGATNSVRIQTENAINTLLTTEVENWLNQSGAQVRVTTNPGLTKDGQTNFGLDYLYPFFNGPKDTLFVQMNDHLWNARNIFNAGIGWRHNFNATLLGGANAFYDQDTTRHHSRLGMGLELWSQRLHGSVNYYLPISDWKRSDAPFLSDSDHYVLYERAARGWDVSLEAALARTVSGQAEFYQWYGDKVDVTGGQSQASQNPYGLKLGLKWQPVPLIALRSEQEFISGQRNNFNVGVDLRWEFGRTLSEMLNSDNAQALPVLQTSRTDFVHRNNHIVLAYKEQKKSWHLYFDPADVTIQAGSAAFINAAKGAGNAHVVYRSMQPEIATVDVTSGRVVPMQIGQTTITAELFASVKDPHPSAVAEYRLTVLPNKSAPSVSDVQIQGSPEIGNTLTGSYIYHANQGEAEGDSLLQWFHADDMTHPLATGERYQVATDDAGKSLIFQVTPQNRNHIMGKAAMAQVAGPTLKLTEMSFNPLDNGVRVDDVTVKYLISQIGKIQFSVKAVDAQGRPMANRAIWWHKSETSPGSFVKTQTHTDSAGYTTAILENITGAGDVEIVASLQQNYEFLAVDGLPQSVKATLKVIKVEPEIQLSVKDNVQQVTVGSSPLTFSLRLKEDNEMGIAGRSIHWSGNGQEAGISLTDSHGLTTIELPVPVVFGTGKWDVEAKLADSSRKARLSLALQKNQTAPLSVKDLSMRWGDAPVALQVSGGNNSPLLYHSDKEDVVTVNAEGQLTVTGVGAAKLTVSQLATETQLAPENATATVTVSKGATPALNASAVEATWGDKPQKLAVSGGNGGTLSFRTSNDRVASVGSDGTLTFTGAGTATVTVSQAATATHLAPQDLTVGVTVNKAAGAALSASAVEATWGDKPQKLAVSGGNGGALSFRTSNDRVVSVGSDGTLTFTGAGTATVTVSQAATATHLAPQDLTVGVTVNKAAGAALSASAVEATWGDKPQKLAVSGGNGDGALSFRSDNTKVASVSSDGTLTFTGAGTTTVTVTQAATATHKAPVPLPVTVTVAKKSPTVVVSMTDSMLVGATQQITVTTDSDGPQTFGLDTGYDVISVTKAGKVTALKAGWGNVTFYIPETANYWAASYSWRVNATLADAPALSAPAVVATWGDKPQKLAVSGGNGDGALSFRSDNTKVASVSSDGTLTFTGAGITTVTVTQAATATHKAPVPLPVTVTVAKKSPTVVVSMTDSMLVGATQQITVTTDSDGPQTFGLDTGYDVISVTKAGKVTALKAGWGNVTFYIPETANYRAASYSWQVNATLADAPALSAPAVVATWGDKPQKLAVSGGNGDGALSFRSDNTKVASVSSDGTLTFTGAGTATVTVTQAATATHKAPAPLPVTVTVAKKSPTVVVSMTDSMLVGATQQITVTTDSDGPQTFGLDTGYDVISVTKAGKVTALKAGWGNVTFYIPETANYRAASYSWRVNATLADAPALSAPAVTVTIGDKAQKLIASGGNGSVMSFSSSNDRVVTVSNNGLLTFTGTGTATVTVSQSATDTHKAPAPLPVTVTVHKVMAHISHYKIYDGGFTGTELSAKVSDSRGNPVAGVKVCIDTYYQQGAHGGSVSWKSMQKETDSGGDTGEYKITFTQFKMYICSGGNSHINDMGITGIKGGWQTVPENWSAKTVEID